MSTQAATQAAPKEARPTPPTVALDTVRGDIERRARRDLARALADADKYGPPEHQGGTGLTEPYSHLYKRRGIALHVLTAESLASHVAWHTYWRQNKTARGAYDQQDEAKMAAAPPRPFTEVGYVVEATWEQVRTWLDGPQQLDLFDALGDAA